MSNQIFGMSEDRMGNVNDPLSLALAVSNGCQSNSTESTSPCSSTSPIDLDGNSSPDIYALDSHQVTEDSQVYSPYPKFPSLSEVRVNLHQACFTTPVNDHINIWNQTISLISSQEMASLEGHPLLQDSGDSSDDASVVISQESMERPSPTELCKALCTSSSENDLPSSREMTRNSFNLEDETLPIFSSLEESLMSPALNSGIFIPECSFASPHLPEGCHGLQIKNPIEGLTGERTYPVYFGMEVIQEDDSEHPAEDDKLNTPNMCNVTLPSEAELCSWRTFLHDSTYSESDAKVCPSAETGAEAARPSNLNATFVQINNNSSADPTPEAKDSAANTQTSTPVLHIGSHFGLLSFSGSSFSGSMDSPAIQPPQDLQIPQMPKHQLIARLSPLSRKAVKTDIQTFPKPDYSGVKSRIMTRLSRQLATPGTVSAKTLLHNSSKMNGCAKPSQVNWKALNKVASAKLRSDPPTVSPTTASILVPKAVSAANRAMGETFIQSDEEDMSVADPPQPCPASITEAAEGVSRASPSNSPVTGSQDASSALSSAALSPSSEQAEPSLPAPQFSNATICSSSLLEAPDGDDGVKASPKKTVSHRDGLRSRSASCGDMPPLAMVRSLDGSTSQSRPSRDKRRTSSLSLGSTAQLPRRPGQQKAKNLCGSAQDKRDDAARDQMTPEGYGREVRKIRLVQDSPMSKSTDASGSSCDQSKDRPGGRGQASPKQPRVLPASRTAVLSPGPRPGPLPRQQGASGAVQRAKNQLQLKQRNPAAHPKAPATDKPTMGAPAPRTKPTVYGSRPLQASSRPSPAGPSNTPGSKAPQKAPGAARSTALKPGTQSDRSRTTGSSSATPLRPSTFKAVVPKTRLLAKPPGDPGAALTASCKSASSSRPGPARSTITPPSRSVLSRIAQLASSLPAEKSKAKAGLRPPQQSPQKRGPQGAGARAPPPAAAATEEDEEGRRKGRLLQKLREVLAAEQRKFEAIAVVLQWTLAERDEVARRSRELSHELVNLQGELVSSTSSCERLEKEKEEVRASQEDALRRLEEQHRDELGQLEARLQLFYQAEWDKVHLTYQEEADKCRSLMEQQIAELKATHEATKLDLKTGHSEHLQNFKQQYEDSVEELRKTQSDALQSLQTTLTDAEATLSGQIRELTEENNALVEKLKAEEERRKQLAGKSQKDSHTLYLEQELESLKVVLDIKNKQLHQQEKKLLQMDSVVDKSVKLDECLKKVMQENEDLKARMDRHAALSRQLSSEQAVLHQSLQKESKVNKRLSMENEELLWKLHNGEVGSPRRLSPASPSHASSFQSPRSSALFSSPPLSPR